MFAENVFDISVNLHLYEGIIYSYPRVDLIGVNVAGYPEGRTTSVAGNWFVVAHFDSNCIGKLRELIEALMRKPMEEALHISPRTYKDIKEKRERESEFTAEAGLFWNESLKELTGKSYNAFDKSSVSILLRVLKDRKTGELSSGIQCIRSGKQVTRNGGNVEFTPLATGDPEFLAQWIYDKYLEVAPPTAKDIGSDNANDRGSMIYGDLSPFGHKMTWYAVKSKSPNDVADAFGLQGRQPVEWNDGIEAAYNGVTERSGTLFVSPVINGEWVVVVGYDHSIDIQTPVPPSDYNPMILELSKKFGEAQFFGSHSTVEWYAWAQAKKGKMRRYFSYLGEADEIQFNIGRRTREEVNLELNFDGENSVPDDEDVIQIASAWSVNPTLDSARSIEGQGLLGNIE